MDEGEDRAEKCGRQDEAAVAGASNDVSDLGKSDGIEHFGCSRKLAKRRSRIKQNPAGR